MNAGELWRNQGSSRDAADYVLEDLACGCQDVHYANGEVDREHDHVQCAGPDFPEGFTGAGPMYAAVPMGEPWLEVALRDEPTFILDSPEALGDPVNDPQGSEALHAAYAGHSVFLEEADIIPLADARDGTYMRFTGLTGWTRETPARRAAGPAESDYWAKCREPEAES